MSLLFLSIFFIPYTPDLALTGTHNNKARRRKHKLVVLSFVCYHTQKLHFYENYYKEYEYCEFYYGSWCPIQVIVQI